MNQVKFYSILMLFSEPNFNFILIKRVHVCGFTKLIMKTEATCSNPGCSQLSVEGVPAPHFFGFQEKHSSQGWSQPLPHSRMGRRTWSAARAPAASWTGSLHEALRCGGFGKPPFSSCSAVRVTWGRSFFADANSPLTGGSHCRPWGRSMTREQQNHFSSHTERPRPT